MHLKKAANGPDLREIPIDPANPWKYVEEAHQDFYELLKRIAYIEDELKTLQKKKPTSLTQPQVTKKHQERVENASIQTENKIATEKMEIEIKEKRWIRCSFLKRRSSIPNCTS